MADEKIKISQLPVSTTFEGLHTIGVSQNNVSVKVPLGEVLEAVEEAKDSANEAADNANAKATAADDAAVNANNKAAIVDDKLEELQPFVDVVEKVPDLENIANVRLETFYNVYDFLDKGTKLDYYIPKTGSAIDSTQFKYQYYGYSSLNQSTNLALPIEAGEWYIDSAIQGVAYCNQFGLCAIPKVSDDFKADMDLFPQVEKFGNIYVSAKPFIVRTKGIWKFNTPMWLVINQCLYETSYLERSAYLCCDIWKVYRDVQESDKISAQKTQDYNYQMAMTYVQMCEWNNKYAMLIKMRPYMSCTYNNKTYSAGDQPRWHSVELSASPTTAFANKVEEVLAFRFDGTSPLSIKGLSKGNWHPAMQLYPTAYASRFYGLECLTELDVSGIDTSSTTSISSIFRNMKSVRKLNVSSFDTRNVTSMSGAFDSCQSIKTLDCSSFDTSKVTAMDSMFNYCGSLEYLDLSSFDTSKVIFTEGQASPMRYIFNGCVSLRYVKVGAGFFGTNCTISFSSCYPLGMNPDGTSNGWIEMVAEVAPDTGGVTKTIELYSTLKNKAWAAPYLTILNNKGYTIA